MQCIFKHLCVLWKQKKRMSRRRLQFIDLKLYGFFFYFSLNFYFRFLKILPPSSYKCKTYPKILPVSSFSRFGTDEGKKAFSRRWVFVLLIIFIMVVVTTLIPFLKYASAWSWVNKSKQSNPTFINYGTSSMLPWTRKQKKGKGRGRYLHYTVQI